MLGLPRPAFCSQFLPAVIFATLCLVTSAGANDGEFIIPPGEHPRLLFTGEDIPRIRERAKTPRGERLVAKLRRGALGHRQKFLKKLKEADPEWMEELKTGARRHLNQYQGKCRAAALLYVATGEEQYGWVAEKLFDVWLSTYPEPERIGPSGTWGYIEWALAYDWIHDRLSPAQRRKARAVFASAVNRSAMEMWKSDWWLEGPRVNGRNVTNWTMICVANLGVTNMVIEGQPGYNPRLAQMTRRMERRVLLEGITPDGGMYEGTSYPLGYGTRFTPLHLMALRLRGVDLIRTTNVPKVGEWLTYEMLPWGGEAQGMNKSMGRFNVGPFNTLLAGEFGGATDWSFLHCTGWLPERADLDPYVALINGIPELDDWTPNVLPLTRWFSTMGKVIARSGWGPRDAHLAYNSNALGAGHSHADHGSFCLASHGVNFITDSPIGRYDAGAHNLILIDGKAQDSRESRTESFIRSVDTSRYADIIDHDLELAYDRALVGPHTGPWYWDEYNPVRNAERRVLFVRGVGGPILVVADDVRKDEKPHEYIWRIHTFSNNNLTAEGRRFAIAERYGGSYLHSMGEGQSVRWVARDVPAATYRGWLLVRGQPYPHRWSNTTLYLNGKAAPYRTTYIQLGNHKAGWFWHPIMIHGREGSPEIEFEGGELELKLVGKTGSQIALAIFTRDPEWQPGFEIPGESEDFLVLRAEEAQQGDPPWQMSHDPKATLHGVFLGEQVPELQVGRDERSGRRVLDAVRKAETGRYLAVMKPSESTESPVLQLGEGNDTVRIASERGVDIVGGVPAGDGRTTGDLVTDAVAASVSVTDRPGGMKILGFAMVDGTMLEYRGRRLVSSRGEDPVHVICDARKLLIRGEGGTRVYIRRLGADTLRVNGQPQPLPAHGRGDYVATIPVLDDEWHVDLRDEGELVVVTGDGPLPLTVPAPDALNCRVNGVDRYFVRDEEGNIWPLLETGSAMYGYPHKIEATRLRTYLSESTKAALVELPTGADVLRLGEGTGVLSVPMGSPATCNPNLRFAMQNPAALTVTIAGKTFEIDPPETAGQIVTRSLPSVSIPVSTARITVESRRAVDLVSLRLEPVFREISAPYWQAIGPFPSRWGGHQKTTENVRSALQEVFPPEKKIDLDATYSGPGEQKVTWHHSNSTDGEYMQAGLNFVKVLGSEAKSHICYAVTFIHCPEKRKARLSIGVDWWARAWLNGEPVSSERPTGQVEKDAAQFFTLSPTKADITLEEGVNTLLLKVHSGSGGNRFKAAITDPGDLRFSPNPE